MKPEVKKWVIVGTLGVISVALALGYLQYKKLMNYVIKFKGIKLKTLTAKVINFDLFINFTNNSDLKFIISDQIYKVYLNDKFVTTIQNGADVTIMPKSTSILPINVSFDPTSVIKLLGQNALSIIASPDKFTLKVDIKLKVSLYGIKVSIPYVYTTTIKELMTPTKPEEKIV